MRLLDWLTERDLPPSWLAAQIGVAPDTVRRYITGERFPRPLKLQAIRDATGGAVSYEDFLTPSPKRRPGRRPPRAA